MIKAEVRAFANDMEVHILTSGQAVIAWFALNGKVRSFDLVYSLTETINKNSKRLTDLDKHLKERLIRENLIRENFKKVFSK